MTGNQNRNLLKEPQSIEINSNFAVLFFIRFSFISELLHLLFELQN